MSQSPSRPPVLRHLVDGRWLPGDGELARSVDPAKPDQVVAEYREAGTDFVDRAVTAAAAAQPAWDAVGSISRGRVLRRAAELLAARAAHFAELMTHEEGKILADSRAEVDATVETLHYHAARGRAPDGQTFPSSHPDELIRTVRRPLGVVAAITPWNFPLQIPAWKIAPALLCGNTVVWKPASDTVALAVGFAELLVDAGVPAGVLNLLLAPGRIGAELVADNRVAGVTFTGSVPVGRAIQAVAVPRGAKIQLELGGHNAAIVLPDVDPGRVADFLVAGAMGSSGQKCTATRRIIAVGSAYDRLLPELGKRVDALVVGDGTRAGVDVGPLVSARARQEVLAAMDTACAEGAEVLAQARSPLPGNGFFVAPALLSGTRDLTICREEVFGPVTTMLRATDVDEAILIANDTAFGLTAAVFTEDERTIRRCVSEVDAGLVKANAPTTGSELHAPFGGLKDSSFPAPREQNGDSAADFFTWTKTAYLRTATPRGGRP